MVVKPEQSPLPLASWSDDGFNLLEAREPGAASGGLESWGLCWTLPSGGLSLSSPKSFSKTLPSAVSYCSGDTVSPQVCTSRPFLESVALKNKTIKTVNEWIENEGAPGPRDLLMSRCIPE